MPKQVVDREEILKAALRMAREQGFESVNARSLAKFMGYSVQPIYSYFANMEQLKDALQSKSLEFYNAFIHSRVDEKSMLLSMAKANIDFAKMETHLFRLLFLTKLKGLNSFNDIFEKMEDKEASKLLAKDLKITEEKAKKVYIKLIIFTHGIATMLATSGAKICDDEILEVVSDAYHSFVRLEKDGGME